MTLYTDSVTPGDEGSYVCVASNFLGNCTYTINFKAQDLQSITSGEWGKLVWTNGEVEKWRIEL